MIGQVKKSEKPWILFVDRAQSRFEDGLENLLRVTVEETSAEIVLTETAHAGFRFEYRSDKYDRAAYYIDLVTLNGLPRYLERTAKRMTAALGMSHRNGVR